MSNKVPSNPIPGILFFSVWALIFLFFCSFLMYNVPDSKHLFLKNKNLLVQTRILGLKFENEISPSKIFFAHVLHGGKNSRKIFKTVIIKHYKNKKLLINELTCSEIEDLFLWLKANLVDCDFITIPANRVIGI
jgi:hypothetical protein